jgi:hypothetical protein
MLGGLLRFKVLFDVLNPLRNVMGLSNVLCFAWVVSKRNLLTDVDLQIHVILSAVR